MKLYLNILVFVLGTLSINVAGATGTRVEVIYATLDYAKAGSLSFNGKSYKYRLDEKNSLYSYSEFDKPPVESWKLKKGNRYYFEVVGKPDAGKGTSSDYVRYVSTEPLEDEESHERTEK